MAAHLLQFASSALHAYVLVLNQSINMINGKKKTKNINITVCTRNIHFNIDEKDRINDEALKYASQTT